MNWEEPKKEEMPRSGESTERSNIEKLKDPVGRLNMLLNDPQPGLSTWQEAAQTNMREVRDEINKILGTEESEE